MRWDPECCRKSGSLRFGSLVKRTIARVKQMPQSQTETLLGELDMSSELTLEQFEELLKSIDSGLRGLPATAQVGCLRPSTALLHDALTCSYAFQVANQQGTYLAKLMKTTRLTPDSPMTDLPRFEYKHKGSLAYVGQDKAVLCVAGRHGTVVDVVVCVMQRSCRLSILHCLTWSYCRRDAPIFGAFFGQGVGILWKVAPP